MARAQEEQREMTQAINPAAEDHARTMLGHAIRGELDDLSTQVHAIGDDAYRQVIVLCLTAARYIAVEAGGRWPTDADLRQIARNAVREETRLTLREEDIYNYLARAALGYEKLEDALGSPEAAASLPVLITASLLFTFRPRGKEWWEYLDQIWDATLKAEDLEEPVIPAVQIRAHRIQTLGKPETA